MNNNNNPNGDGNGNDNNVQVPEIQHARDYVARVKSSLGQTSPQYRLFLHTLKLYRTRELTPQAVIDAVSDLLRGNRQLILGFNAFLPPEYQILEAGIVDVAAVAVVPMEDEDDREENNDGNNPSAAEVVVVVAENERKPAAAARANNEPIMPAHPPRPRHVGSVKSNNRPVVQEEDYSVDDYSRKKQSRRSRKRMRVRVARPSLSKDTTDITTKNKNAKTNIKVTSYASTSNSSSSSAAAAAAARSTPAAAAVVAAIKNSVKLLDPATTRIILSPPKVQPSTDMLHTFNPLHSNGEEITIHLEEVHCKLCNGKRDAIAIERNEPVLLCEQRGCNAEYHLGCLYNYRPALFPAKEKDVDGDANDGVTEEIIANIELQQEQQQQQQQCDLEVPPGDIFCTKCHTQGATSVLEKYFDKIDYERSHYKSNRGYVTALLKKHMSENPSGNNAAAAADQVVVGTNIMGGEEVRLKCSPRSELWYANELNRQALEKQQDGKNTGEFLVGKPVRLYNNLDNEYHVGRIVDWRTCTVYKGNASGGGPPVSKNNTVHLKDLPYYGIGPLSTSEFLVRFPSGLQGRKKELLRWIMLEEHSLAVGVSLIQGKTAKVKGGNSNGVWKPAMILARSALELVTVRQFLHEDEEGNLFATMNKGEGKSSGDRWGLASFFGEEQHALLRLRDEARDLLVDVVDHESNGVEVKKYVAGENDGGQTGEEEDAQPLIHRHSLASVEVQLGLALAEHAEQQRCKEWCQLILQNSNHEHALISSDEYSTQLTLEKEESRTKNDGSSSVSISGEEAKEKEEEETTTAAGDIIASSKSIQPLVERGMDRLWLAQLMEKQVSSSSTRPMSKDVLMSFKCENVSSVANAMSSLQRQQ